MLGLNALARFLRRFAGPRFECSGLLPGRYYLLRAVAALEEDDIDEAVRLVSLAMKGRCLGAKGRLVCQQIIFRCRVLAAFHQRRTESIRAEMEVLGKTAAIREHYRRLQQTESRAREILVNYEHRLVELPGGGCSARPRC